MPDEATPDPAAPETPPSPDAPAAAPQPPADPAEPAAPQPPADPAANGPWTQDLESFFEDPAARARADEFLRQKVQPYVTDLETKSKGYGDAARLYDDLTTSPVETYAALTSELFDPATATAVLEALRTAADDGSAPAPDPELTHEQMSALPPEAQEAIAYVNEQRQRETYNAEIERVRADNPDLNPDLLAPFIIAAEGNMDAAVAGYNDYYAKVKESLAPAAPVTPADVPDAPATLDGGTAPTPPVEKQYPSLGAAVDDFFAEQKAAPVTVGTD